MRTIDDTHIADIEPEKIIRAIKNTEMFEESASELKTLTSKNKPKSTVFYQFCCWFVA